MTDRSRRTPPLRWGICGTGAIARKFAEALARTRGASLVAAASRRAGEAASFVREAGAASARAYTGYDGLLRDADVQAVYVATIHPTHAELCIAAARAGKHVLCEKPLTLCEADAERMVSAAGHAGVFLMEGYMYRVHPLWRRVVDLVRDGAVGRPTSAEASFGFRRPADSPRPRLTDRALGGGAIWDVGCYPVSALRDVASAAGQPDASPGRVLAHGLVEPDTRVDLSAAALLGWSDGFTAHASCSVVSWLPNRVVVTGDEGGLEVVHPWHGTGHHGGESVIRVWRRTNTTSLDERIEAVATDRWLFQIEAEHVAECVDAGLHESPLVPWDDSIGIARTLDAWRAGVGAFEVEPGKAD